MVMINGVKWGNIMVLLMGMDIPLKVCIAIRQTKKVWQDYFQPLVKMEL